MKASIKFREDQKPLIRAKVPLSILNFPFQSGVVAGESKELSLNLATSFDSGPSFKLSYKPNDSHNPFSFVFKTGIGHFGSPVNSPLTMTAHFNLIGNENPTFFIHFNPQFGDFKLNKSHSSSSLAFKPDPVLKPDYFQLNDSAVAGAVENMFSGTAVTARTTFPVTARAAVGFRWGLRVPKPGPVEDPDTVVIRKNNDLSFSLKQCPLLVMNKISIEHVARDDSKKRVDNADLAQACLDVKQKLEAIQSENGLLRSSLNDLRSDIANFSFDNRDVESSKGKYLGVRTNKKTSNVKAGEGDVTAEMSKA